MAGTARRALGPADPHEPESGVDRSWFFDHYESAAGQIVSFLAPDGISLTGRRVADIGCGDGIIDLGLARATMPAELVGFDIVPTDTVELRRQAELCGVGGILPAELSFRTSAPVTLPSEDDYFDIIVTWSAFEHVGDPLSLLRDAHRILRPDGVLFLQLWPFYHSERGSHLWEWCPESFHHLVDDEAEVAETVRQRSGGSAWGAQMIEEFRSLNRITVDELQTALQDAGFSVRKMELMTNAVHIPAGLAHYRLSDLGVSGIKLIATPS